MKVWCVVYSGYEDIFGLLKGVFHNKDDAEALEDKLEKEDREPYMVEEWEVK